MARQKLSTAARKARSEKRRARKAGKGGSSARGADAAILGAMIGGAGLEPITPALIEAMRSSGRWTEEEGRNAEELAREGFQYHRGRNSFFGPTEFCGMPGEDDEADDEPFVDGEGVIHDPDVYAAELGRRLGPLAEAPNGEGTVSFDEALARVAGAKSERVAAYTFRPRHRRGAVVGGELHIVYYAPDEEDEGSPAVWMEMTDGTFGDETGGGEDNYPPSDAPSEVRSARFRLTEQYDAGVGSYVTDFALLRLAGLSEEEAFRGLD